MQVTSLRDREIKEIAEDITKRGKNNKNIMVIDFPAAIVLIKKTGKISKAKTCKVKRVIRKIN